MGPDSPLPISAEFSSVDEYVDSLLKFATSSWLLQTLCGGVHILDFYTRSPDLYSTILPESWRVWFKECDIMDILDLLMREDLTQFDSESVKEWRNGPAPPNDLISYLKEVRKHLLGRDFPSTPSKSSIARHIAVGMKVKKVHEVDNFARYVDKLTADISAAGKKEISHLVDFGSGQNYLGRALAAPPYSKHLVAVESRQHNIEGAKNMDVLARLVPKPLVMRNKKEFREQLKKQGKWKKGLKSKSQGNDASVDSNTTTKNDQEDLISCDVDGCEPVSTTQSSQGPVNEDASVEAELNTQAQQNDSPGTPPKTEQVLDVRKETETTTTTLQIYTEGHGSVQYVGHVIKDGDLGPVVEQILDSSRVSDEDAVTSGVVEEPANLGAVPKLKEPNLMVMSLHSCGNLVHHGLRSLLLNPAVSTVAMVGCCYNLVTERLGPPTYKLPTLRPNHPRLEKTAGAFDPHGFPMSEKLAEYPLPYQPFSSTNGGNANSESPKGIRLNITARMMAVQAPFNWGPEDSELFFTRHFYRALLQRIFLDRGVIAPPVNGDGFDGDAVSAAGHSSKVNWTPPNGRGPGLSSDGTTTPLTIGTLRKFAYNDFVSYVRAAIGKLTAPNSFCEVDPDFIRSKMDGLTDEDIRNYEQQNLEKKKELSVMWGLMAFSAGVVEAVIVTDRWLWLKEQPEVETAWVEPVFEYKMSPRNLVVVGIKK